VLLRDADGGKVALIILEVSFEILEVLILPVRQVLVLPGKAYGRCSYRVLCTIHRLTVKVQYMQEAKLTPESSCGDGSARRSRCLTR
jgi:hypothetical protein